MELGCLGLLGTFWLGASQRHLIILCAQLDVALGAFLASSNSENADVECFSSVDGSQVVNVAGYILVSTETYQAQYRVLEAFSLFNVILGKWPAFIFYLFLNLS
ncbi:hypothetical protein J3R82DRAFT_4091 [Butyriboletus roseoflavus]|nr:hypothetical protein J3R82DRAFT_4091 [Butyriboletus roseoflavus]